MNSFHRLSFKLILIFLCSFVYSVANQNYAQTIASLSAQYLYELDKEGLQRTLKTYLQEEQEIESLLVIDLSYNEIYWRYNNNDTIDQKLCSNKEPYLSADILYDNKKIGLVKTCLKKQNKQPSQSTDSLSINNKIIAKDVTALSAPFLYDLEKKQLQQVLLPFIETHRNISSLQIVDSVDHTAFFNYEVKEKQKLTQCRSNEIYFHETIKFRDEEIGKVHICFKEYTQIPLSKKELSYLKKHPIIQVHNEKDWAPINFYEFGQPRGFSIDIMNLIAKKTGLNIKYLSGPTWDQHLTMLKKHEIDVMLNIAKNENRNKNLIYSDAYYTPLHGLLIRSEDKNTITSFKDIVKGKIVAVEKGFYYHDFLKKHYPDIPLFLTDTTSEAVQAVAFGQADVSVGIVSVLNYFQEKNNIKSLKIIENVNSEEFEKIPLQIATHKNAPELLSIIQKGLAAITPTELKKIKKRWLLQDDVTEEELILSPRLQNWIKKHPTIKVGGEMDWAPFDFVDDSGEYTGLTKDYLDYIAMLTGLHFEIQTGQTWNTLINSIKEGSIDLLPAIYYKKQRESFISLTDPYLTITDFYITRKEYEKIENIKQLFGKKIAAIKGYESITWLKTNFPQIEVVEYDSLLETLRAVESGECVATINDNPSATYVMEKNFITSLTMNNIVKNRKPSGLHMGVKKEYEPLVEIINLALKTISRETKKKISNRWMSELNINDISLDLNSEETNWLLKRPVIKFAVDPNWLPIEGIDQESSTYTGMMADYLELISKYTGIEFKLIPTKSWSESLELIKNKQVDMLAASSKTTKREKFLNFSDNTLTLSDGIIMRNDGKFISDINDLQNFKIGISHGTALHKMIEDKYPKLQLQEIKGVENAIELLSKEKIDAYIGNLEVISYIIFQKNLLNLKVVYKFEEQRELHIAFHKEYSTLALSVINKAINIIPNEEITRIRQKWIGLNINEEVNYDLILKIILLTIVITLLFTYYNRKLKKTVDEKTRDLKDQISQFDKNVIFSKTDLNGNITHVSEAFCKISGYSYAELVGKPHNIVRHEDMKKEIFYNLWDTLQNKASLVLEIKNKKKNGEFYWLESKFEADYDKDGQHIGYTALRVDITDKKAVQSLSKSLENKVIERTQELENERKYINSVVNSQENIVISTHGDRIRTANQAFFKFFQINTLEEFFEKFGLCICHTFDKNSSDEFIHETYDGELWIDYILKHPQKIHKAKITLNDNSYIFSISADKFIHNDEIQEVAVFTNITELETIREEVEAIHKHTKDSIEYASLIQHTLIPDTNLLKHYFSDYFAIWNPKDIVGGDIYLFDKLRDDNECLLMVIDCTGHGVPGAFVTMLVKAIERQIIAKFTHSDEIVSPAKILSIFNKSMKHLLKQEDANSISNAGFDGGILYYNKEQNIIKYAGAETPLFYIDENGEFQTIKGSRHSVGYKKSDSNYNFKEHTIEVEKGMQFYLTTDGYLDQNGGEKGFPFGKKRFKTLIEESKDKSFAKQQDILLDTLIEYQKDEERNDDVTLVGIKI